MQHDEAVRAARQARGGGRALGRPAGQRRRLLPGRRALRPARVRRDRQAAAASRASSTATAFLQRVPARNGRPSNADHGADLRTEPGSGPQPAAVRPVYFPIAYVAADYGSARPARLRPRRRPRPGAATCASARDSGKPAATPARAAADRRPRHQRLPARLPRRRADLDTVAERRAAPDSASPPAPSGSATSPRRRPRPCPAPSTCSCGSASGSVVGDQGALDDAAQRRRSTIADRTWLLVVRDPNRPDLSLPLLLAGVGIALAALLAALILVWSRNERMQELRARSQRGLADRAEEPAPLRARTCGWRWPARRRERTDRGAADDRPRPLQARQRLRTGTRPATA